MRDKKNEGRRITTGPLRYRVSNPQGKLDNDIREDFPDVGIVLNVSNEGLCFITTRPLEEGQTLVIECPWLIKGMGIGTVRWCQKEAIDLWRVGLQRINIGSSHS